MEGNRRRPFSNWEPPFFGLFQLEEVCYVMTRISKIYLVDVCLLFLVRKSPLIARSGGFRTVLWVGRHSARPRTYIIHVPVI